MRLSLVFGLGLAFFRSLVAGEVQVTQQTTVSFANVARERQILTHRDAFLQSLSLFDRAARMKVETPPSESAFANFVGDSARAWTSAEMDRLGRMLQDLSVAFKPWSLPFPHRIELVKTSGREEGGAAYTRQAAVVLSEQEVAGADTNLLTHELFHILSRTQPELRARLYRIIGFTMINQVELPSDLRDVKITDPDGESANVMIEVATEGQRLPVLPLLSSSSPHYDPNKGGEFFKYLTFRLLVLQQAGGVYAPRLRSGKAWLLDPSGVPDYLNQIGRNTQYIIHPDEILADNFVFLIANRTNLATPRIVAEMKKVLLSGPR
jgi:hypothetical protein